MMIKLLIEFLTGTIPNNFSSSAHEYLIPASHRPNPHDRQFQINLLHRSDSPVSPCLKPKYSRSEKTKNQNKQTIEINGFQLKEKENE
jgi:hypothetical protein